MLHELYRAGAHTHSGPERLFLIRQTQLQAVELYGLRNIKDFSGILFGEDKSHFSSRSVVFDLEKCQVRVKYYHAAVKLMKFSFNSHLAGYKQQDAHEFFIATLNLLHIHFREGSKAQQNDPFNCIVDEIFTGENVYFKFEFKLTFGLL